MEPEALLTTKDYWDIGIGISGIALTLIAVGIAIWIPAWQRRLELREKTSLRNSEHTAIFAWIRNDLDVLERTIEERIKNDPDQFGDINMTFDGLEHFTIAQPNSIRELRSSPGLMLSCPNTIIRLLWDLGELDLDIESMRARPDEVEASKYEEIHEYFVKLHYKPLLQDLIDIYYQSHDLGLEVRNQSSKS